MVNLIAAVGKRGQLGLNGKLPWRDPEDLRWFRLMTQNGIVIIGGNTLQKLPPLPDRLVVGWGRGIEPGSLLDNLREMAPGKNIWIAGGARTYEAFMPFVRRSFITHVDYDGEADTWLDLGMLTGARS